MRVTRTIQVKWVTAPSSAAYTDLADIGIGRGIWQIIPKDGGIYFNDGCVMSAAANPYTISGIYIPRDCSDFFVEFQSEAASIYLPAGTSVCLRKVEID